MLDATRIALGNGGHVQTMSSLLTNYEMLGIYLLTPNAFLDYEKDF